MSVRRRAAKVSLNGALGKTKARRQRAGPSMPDRGVRPSRWRRCSAATAVISGGEPIYRRPARNHPPNAAVTAAGPSMARPIGR